MWVYWSVKWPLICIDLLEFAWICWSFTFYYGIHGPCVKQSRISCATTADWRCKKPRRRPAFWQRKKWLPGKHGNVSFFKATVAVLTGFKLMEINNNVFCRCIEYWLGEMISWPTWHDIFFGVDAGDVFMEICDHFSGPWNLEIMFHVIIFFTKSMTNTYQP